MAHNYIIQWNCRGLRSNREDIELLITKYSPAAICLQETLLTPHQTQTFKHYSAYYKSGIHGHGGVCILVKNKFINSQVQFQADLQAIAVCITINNKTYTVVSVYVPPSEATNELAFDRMINSFSSRDLLLGDFNGHSHSHLLGANQENERGKIVEKLIDRHNLYCGMTLFILGLILIMKIAPYLIFRYVILLYTWMLRVRFHQTD